METQVKKQILIKSLWIAEKKESFNAMQNELDELDDNELFYEAKKKLNQYPLKINRFIDYE